MSKPCDGLDTTCIDYPACPCGVAARRLRAPIIGCVQHDCEECRDRAATIAALQERIRLADALADELADLLESCEKYGGTPELRTVVYAEQALTAYRASGEGKKDVLREALAELLAAQGALDQLPEDAHYNMQVAAAKRLIDARRQARAALCTINSTHPARRCNYQGYEFGAGRYPDSVCIDGRLYDADACDDDGNLYEPVEDIPCPMCHPRKAIQYWTDQNRYSGLSARRAADAAKSLVADIRKNRGVENKGARRE